MGVTKVGSVGLSSTIERKASTMVGHCGRKFNKKKGSGGRSIQTNAEKRRGLLRLNARTIERSARNVVRLTTPTWIMRLANSRSASPSRMDPSSR